MKTLSLIIALTLSVTISNAQEEKSGETITVTIENITNNSGHVIISLHTEDTFMKSEGIQMEKSEIVDGHVTVTFNNVEAGAYAIMALHDENDNNSMDFEDTGMPKESYGMSNNPAIYGPPQFSSAKFDLKEDLELKIQF